jgi:uncharacterized membrane protein
MLVFDTLAGAELAYADARDRARDEPWLDEVAFAEHHLHGRIAFRGVFAGHYVQVDDVGDPIGPETGIGALSGALLGAIFGPPGFATGLVSGAAIGGLAETLDAAPRPQAELFEEIRRELPEASSAVLLLASPEHVDSMLKAFDGLGGRLVRRSLSDEQVRALAAAVATAPPARTT